MSTHDKLVELENRLEAGKITRRDFIASGAAIAAAAGLTAFPSEYGQAATPKKGGRFRVGITSGDTGDSLDPATASNPMAIFLQWQVRNNLVEQGPNSELVPELAESWEASDDAATWVFNLRKGVEFHNGKTLDAQDVIASINHHRGEDSKSAVKSFVEGIEEIKADGKHKVIMKLGSGNADYPFIFADYHLEIFPAGTANLDDGVGTGGYILETFEPGVRAFTKRNPNYWKEDRAHFDEVETILIVDDAARQSALRTDKIDATHRVDLKPAHLLEKVPELKLLETAGKKHYTFPMLGDKAPYDNMDVRMALKYAVDRDKILDTVLKGHGQLGNDHPISRSNRYHADDLPQRVYDPDKARFHIKKAGLDNHVFKLSTSDGAFSGAVDTAVLYKEHAAKAGINIEVVRESADGYWKKVWIKRDWCMAYWSGRPTEDLMFSTAYAADAKWNDSHFQHERFNELLLKARVELDDQKRREMYGEMQRIVRDEGNTVIPIFANDVMAMNERVLYENVSSAWDLDSYKASERWWFA
jgi:peptide/nickel transport system substrate-binding protein